MVVIYPQVVFLGVAKSSTDQDFQVGKKQMAV